MNYTVTMTGETIEKKYSKLELKLAKRDEVREGKDSDKKYEQAYKKMGLTRTTNQIKKLNGGVDTELPLVKSHEIRVDRQQALVDSVESRGALKDETDINGECNLPHRAHFKEELYNLRQRLDVALTNKIKDMETRRGG